MKESYLYFIYLVIIKKIMIMKYILFILALANLIAIAILTYKNKKNWVMSLSIVEIVLVYLALIINI